MRTENGMQEEQKSSNGTEQGESTAEAVVEQDHGRVPEDASDAAINAEDAPAGDQLRAEDEEEHRRSSETAGQDEAAAEVAESEAQGPDPEGANGAAGEEESDEEPTLAEQIEVLQDQYLRALADNQNLRRISEREVQDAKKFGAERLARALLPVHDYLQQALDSVDDVQREHSSALIEGIELTLKELLNAIGRNGVTVVNPENGDRFDPKIHEAMFEAPSPDIEPGGIFQVISVGFKLHDRLLRPANVGVSSGSPSQNVEVQQAGKAEPALN